MYAVEIVGMVAAILLDSLSVKRSLKLTEGGKLPSCAAQGVYQGPVSCGWSRPWLQDAVLPKS